MTVNMARVASKTSVASETRVASKTKSQPTTFDHINIKYIWGPHGKPYGDPILITYIDLQKSVHIK